MVNSKIMKELNFSEFTSFFDSVLKRPGMFGIYNVDDMNMFIVGFIRSLYFSDNVEFADTLINYFAKFRKFLNEKYETGNDYDWAKLIRLNTGSGMHSLERFVALFQEFHENNNWSN
jgi:hypothetical protein